MIKYVNLDSFFFSERQQKNLTYDLRNIRNDWAHQKSMTDSDTYRTIDSVEKMLKAAFEVRYTNFAPRSIYALILISIYQPEFASASFNQILIAEQTRRLFTIKMAERATKELQAVHANVEGYQQQLLHQLSQRYRETSAAHQHTASVNSSTGAPIGATISPHTQQRYGLPQPQYGYNQADQFQQSHSSSQYDDSMEM
jgi:hypothetical protein